MANSSVQPVLALLGFPVAGNPTQYMLEKALAYHQLDWRYLSLEVRPEDLGSAVQGMRAMGFRGGNCTDPHKQAILPHLDRLSRSAELIGAVNCLVRDEAALVGENTEGRACVEAVRRRADPAGKRAVLLGAGRMGRAVAVELALAHIGEIIVVNRGQQLGRDLVELLTGRLQTPAALVVWDRLWAVPPETHLVVHATSIQADEPLPLDLENLLPETIVAEVAFNPPRRWLLRQATERGLPAIDGLEVFVEQAAINFRLWTGVEAERSVLREAVEEFLEL
ncbi:MAG: shikimate dehydrogenase family protein [Thermoguttaceae bacterium]